ncbi:MAG: hypothetical protein JXB04_02270 [Kiritimatiellae bacterium]|nr:hypothetical protein [Kiritimatiellia bacterium]
MKGNLPHTSSRRPYAAEFRWKPLLQVLLLLLGVLVIVGIIVDARALSAKREAAGQGVDVATDIQTIILGLNGERIQGPGGLFSIVPPAGWRITRRPQSEPYDVRFIGPNGVDIGIMARRVDYSDFNTLVRNLEQIERDTGMNTHIQPIMLGDRPAARRESSLHRVKVLAIDLVDQGVEHHIMCRIPHRLFEKYEPVLMDVLNTYRPAGRVPDSGGAE